MSVLEGFKHPGALFSSKPWFVGPTSFTLLPASEGGWSRDFSPCFSKCRSEKRGNQVCKISLQWTQSGVSHYIWVHPLLQDCHACLQRGSHLGVVYWLFEPCNNVIYIYIRSTCEFWRDSDMQCVIFVETLIRRPHIIVCPLTDLWRGLTNKLFSLCVLV